MNSLFADLIFGLIYFILDLAEALSAFEISLTLTSSSVTQRSSFAFWPSEFSFNIFANSFFFYAIILLSTKLLSLLLLNIFWTLIFLVLSMISFSMPDNENFL